MSRLLHAQKQIEFELNFCQVMRARSLIDQPLNGVEETKGLLLSAMYVGTRTTLTPSHLFPRQPHSHARHVRRSSRRPTPFAGTSTLTPRTNPCWCARAATARHTSLPPSTFSTTSAKCTWPCSSTSAPSRTAHACSLCV